MGRGRLIRAVQQIVDQYFGVNLFLNIQWRRMNDQVRPILLIFAAPNQLRIEITVAAFISYSDGVLLILTHDRLIFNGRGMFLRVDSSCLRVSTLRLDLDFLVAMLLLFSLYGFTRENSVEREIDVIVG